MTRMVQVAVAGDVAEAEDIEQVLLDAGIGAQLEAGEDYPLRVLVPETDVEAAQDALDGMVEPDELEPGV